MNVIKQTGLSHSSFSTQITDHPKYLQIEIGFYITLTTWKDN